MLKPWTMLLIAIIVSIALSYSATILSVRFGDMQRTIQANAACTDFYTKAIAPPQGRVK